MTEKEQQREDRAIAREDKLKQEMIDLLESGVYTSKNLIPAMVEDILGNFHVTRLKHYNEDK